MAYLHSHDIIHRDLKPANILEDDFLFPKIADFGLSKTIHTNAESMSTDSTIGLKGTFIYLPPESWDYYQYTKAGDVYAFAIIVYEILTLQIPFEGLTYGMICKKVSVNGDRPEFKYPIPDCYHSLIARCWAQDPEERPTFEQIVEELKNNDEFITDCVDKDEFLDYVDMIDSLGCSFDPQKKFKKISLFNTTEINSNDSKIIESNSNNSKLIESDSNNSKLIENNSKKKIVNLECNLIKGSHSISHDFKRIKVVVFGAGGSGKSALVIQFMQGYFITDYDPTIDDVYRIAVSVDEHYVALDIIDTAGRDDFAPMRTSYIRQGEAFVLVYSIDDRASFSEIPVFHRDLCRVKGTSDIPIVICSHDYESNHRSVSQEEGEKLAQQLNAGFVEASSIDNINVDKVFEILIHKFIEKEKSDLSKKEKSDLPKKEKKKKFSFFKKKKH